MLSCWSAYIATNGTFWRVFLLKKYFLQQISSKNAYTRSLTSEFSKHHCFLLIPSLQMIYLSGQRVIPAVTLPWLGTLKVINTETIELAGGDGVAAVMAMLSWCYDKIFGAHDLWLSRPIFCLLFGVSPGCARSVTGQVKVILRDKFVFKELRAILSEIRSSIKRFSCLLSISPIRWTMGLWDIWTCFCLLLGVSTGCAWPITGRVFTSVTWPVIGWA